jgi:50S ribosomal protein L16 3-hydroxylase
MTLQLLGDVTVKQFLSRHWQKKPLVVRDAIPDFKGIIQATELLRLAQRDDVESRWVERSGRRWVLRHGPFTRAQIARAPARRWTLLVQGVNLHHAGADALLQRFAFLPYARLDDLMVSYAAPGGGVGPHLDSYDVFLLQGPGRRRWRYGRARDASLVRNAPLKLLRRFQPESQCVLGPGDMLYLPPGWAHDGVALDACTTYSIGFRAPSAIELGRALLGTLDEHLEARLHHRGHEDRFADRGAAPSGRPGEIPAAMAEFALRAARAVAPRRADVERALGEHLSEPKPQVAFEPPAPAMSRARFAARARKSGVRLDPRSRLLYRRGCFYINGEALGAPRAASTMLCTLADARRLEPRALAALRGESALFTVLHGWYQAGWLAPGDERGGRDGRDA